MKQHLPYNILLVLAVVVAGLAVLYNLELREAFGVVVRYDYPDPGKVEQQAAPVVLYSEEYGVSEEDVYVESDYYDIQPETVVLVTFPLDVNKATVSELMYIPRVGSAMAQRITQYRSELGGYTELEQLKQIKGVGDKTYEVIAAYLYIQDQWPEADDAGQDASLAQAQNVDEE